MSKKKIMIVDDEPDIRIFVRKALEKEGYEVVEKNSGGGCLDYIKKEKIDLILLDVMMPMLDGWEVCKKIKAYERNKDIKIVMLTIKESEDDIICSLEGCGADWHISKPVYMAELVKTVNWQLESSPRE